MCHLPSAALPCECVREGGRRQGGGREGGRTCSAKKSSFIPSNPAPSVPAGPDFGTPRWAWPQPRPRLRAAFRFSSPRAFSFDKPSTPPPPLFDQTSRRIRGPTVDPRHSGTIRDRFPFFGCLLSESCNVAERPRNPVL